MIAEQLQDARSTHWRQQNNPILALEDAERWLTQHPLCLFLPRRAQLPVPAPSFVEACLGKAEATPGPDAIGQAQALLTRLASAGTVVPLNLMGTVGEQPDFLATKLALPFVLSLRAEPDWRRAPQTASGRRVSPLVIELWKLLNEKSAMTAEEAREILGRELTEAAVLRALSELWQGLRISPVYGEEDKPARWEMMRMRHKDALITAAGTGQVTALSLLVSMYLESVYAATSEEIEVFLSPVASRSRAREAVRGLSATRQIQSLSMGAQTYYFLKEGLPEFAPVTVAEPEEPPTPVASPARTERQSPPSARSGGWQRPQRSSEERALARPRTNDQRGAAGDQKPWTPQRKAHASAPPGDSRTRERSESSDRFRRGKESSPRREGSQGRPPFKPRSGPPRSAGGPPRREGAQGRPPFKPRTESPRSAGGPPRREGAQGRPPFKPRTESPRSAGGPPRREGAQGRPPFKPRGGPPRSAGGPPRREGAQGRPPFKPRSGPPRSAGAPPRREGAQARPPFEPRSGPPRSAGAPPRREGAQGRPPFKPRSGPPGAAGGPPRREGGQSKPPFKPRSGPPRSAGAPPRREGAQGRPPFKPRSGPPGAAGGPPRREGGQGKPPFKPRTGSPRTGPRKFDNRPGRRNAPRKKPDA